MRLKNCQKGVAVYLALVVTAVVLAIAIGLSVILIGQIKIARGIGNSVVALYAADSGIEKILYEESLCRTKDASGECVLAGASSNCFGDCQGLASGKSFPLDTPTMIYNADFAIEEDETTGDLVMKLKSVGDYKNTKRAIETIVPMPLVNIIIDCSTLDCADLSQVDWVWETTAGLRTPRAVTFNVAYLVGANRQRALFKWNLGTKIPIGGVFIDSATLHFCDTKDAAGTGKIQLSSFANDGWSSGDGGLALYTWPPIPDSLSPIGAPYTQLNQWECKNVDVTSQVRNELALGADGILSLKWEAPGPKQAFDFYASPTYSDPAYQPYIEIKYTRR